MRIQRPTITQIAELKGDGANLTGSFSGSFTEWEGLTNKPADLVSGSAQLATDISGSFTSVSSSLASRVTSLDADGTTDAELNAATSSLSASLATDIATKQDILSEGGFADGDKTKLDGIEASADVTDATNVEAAGAVMDSEVTDLDGIKSLTVPNNTTISTFGASLVDDADAAAARTTLGVDAAGTDNSTDVTLAGTPDYITISGQTITRGQVDLTADVTGDLPISEGGTGASTAAAARTNLGVDAAGTDNSTDVTLAGSYDYITISGQTITRGQIDISDDTNLAVSDTSGQTGINMSLTGDTLSGVVSGLGTSATPTFSGLTVSNDVTINGDLTVLGDATELQVSALNVEDINITIASGAADSSAANGAGITIAGANESLTWDHGNSRFTFSDDLNVGGNITLSGTVDGVDIASRDHDAVTLANTNYLSLSGQVITGGTVPVASGGTGATTAAAARTNLGVDPAGTVNYTHPSHPGDDISIDTGALTGATVISDLDFNVTTDTLGHVTDANAAVSTRNLTLANLGYTGATDATNNTGTVTSVGITTSAGLNGSGTITTSGTVNISLDLSELTDMTADVAGASDELILLDSGAERRKAINEIKLSQFNNDSGWTSNVGDITGVTAGNGLTGGGSSGAVTLNIGAGTGVSVAADSISIGQAVGTTSNVSFGNIDSSGRIQVTGTDGVIAKKFVDYDNGNYYFDGAATGDSIRVAGDIVAYYTSDARLKDDITPLDNALDKVKTLSGNTFVWNDKSEKEVGAKEIGVVAQEVQAAFPELVHERDNGYLSVDYPKLTAVLIEAVKELSNKVDELSK